MTSLALPTGAKRPVGLALPTMAQAPSAAGSPAVTNPPARSGSSNAVPSLAAGARAADGVRASASPSPEPDEDADGDGDDDDDDGGKKSKGSKKKKSSTVVGPPALDATGKQEYRYSNEIAQMMFVFGEVQDPLPDTVKLVEDIVRGQIIEIVTRARLLTHIRSSRFLSAEDLIFLIRDDRGKVNRLRTYLSWKDVRKKVKEDNEDGGDVDVDEAERNAGKGRKPIVKLSWELLTPFSDFLRGLPTQQNRAEEEEEEDEDEMQAHQDSMQRLREADEITKKMTKDEYVHYSDCRQASFTYRKARRFREFINFGAYLDVRPNDDIVDILGFLSFEMVRSLCVTALEVREQLDTAAPVVRNGGANTSPTKRKATLGGEASPSKRARHEPEGVSEDATPGGTEEARRFNAPPQPRSLFAPPPSARQPLLPSHVLEAFAQIQRKQTSNRIGGMQNWRGGISRTRVALV